MNILIQNPDRNVKKRNYIPGDFHVSGVFEHGYYFDFKDSIQQQRDTERERERERERHRERT